MTITVGIVVGVAKLPVPGISTLTWRGIR